MALNRMWDNEKFDEELKKVKPNWRRTGEVINGLKTVQTLCEKGHTRNIQPSKIKNGLSCNQCNLELIKLQNGTEFIEELINKNYTPLFKPEEYINNLTKMMVICPNNENWETSKNAFCGKDKSRCRCLKCIENVPKPKKPHVRTKDECIDDLRKKGFLMYTTSEYKGVKYEVKGKWIECGHEATIKPDNILNKNCKCKECRKWTLENFILFLNEENKGITIKEKQKFHMKEPIDLVCLNGHEFSGYPQNIIYYDYNCPFCTNENKSGSSSHLFDDYLSEEERINGRNQKYSKDWVKSVKERDYHMCRLCSEKENIVAHHLFGFKRYKSLRFEINNGITLCNDCHLNFHNKFGYINNTIDQFIEFCILENYKNMIDALMDIKINLINVNNTNSEVKINV